MIPKYSEIASLLKKGATLEAQEKIMELREAVIELQEENGELKKNIESLQSDLDFKKSLTFNSPFYFADNDPVPYCPRCWEADRKAVHLPPAHQVHSGTRYDCLECENMYIHPRRNR